MPLSPLGESNGMINRAPDRTQAMFVHTDEGAVNETELSFRFSSQVSKNFAPEASLHPSAPTMVDRVPTSPIGRKCPPSTSLSQEVNDGLVDIVRGERRSSDVLGSPRFP
jgi:hypothetical protein